jgi:hypothetical protein
MADVNGTLFFGADDGTHGDELWSLAAGGATAPTAVTGQVTNLSSTGATLNGTVNPNGAQVSDCHFDYITTNFASAVPCSQSPGAGTSPVAVSAAISGLAANTTYDYRLIATGPGGTSTGAKQTFTTPAPTTLTTTQTSSMGQGASIAVPNGTTGERDGATITGDKVFFATGTVTFGLYSSPQCTQGSQVFTSTNRVLGGPGPFAAANSDPVTTQLSPNNYYWTASYSGNSRNQPSANQCGDERLTILPPSPTTLGLSQAWQPSKARRSRSRAARRMRASKRTSKVKTRTWPPAR